MALFVWLWAGLAAQATTPALVGTWRLVSIDGVQNPIGILIQDARGNVIEIVTRAGRAAPMNAADQFTSYRAWWGSYVPDASGSTATYTVTGDLDPRRTGQKVTRSFTRTDNRLVLSESGGSARTTCERVAELEALPDYQRDVIGFWQWTSAGMVDSAGAQVRETARDPGVIVYTPTGLMAVLYLPPPVRKAPAGPAPTVEEAAPLMQGAPTYFGPYLVQPRTGSVIHYQLATPNPAATGSSLQRNFEVTGSELVLRFPPTTVDGRTLRNVIHLKRLSGIADMSR